MNTQTQEALKMAGYELDGVIADVEKFDGFDDVCLQTIKRIRSTIAEALEQQAQHNFCSRCGKRASKDPNHIHTCTPPHQWQELTNEDIARLILINEVDGTGDVGLARLVEHASRIKNHG
jgi:hypothetical protein